jgi:hypothetical protein
VDHRAHIARLKNYENKADSSMYMAPTEQRVLRDFPNEGIYEAFFVVQRRNNSYRDLDNEVLTAVEAMWHYNVSSAAAQAGLDAIEEENNKTIIGAGAARSVFGR